MSQSENKKPEYVIKKKKKNFLLSRVGLFILLLILQIALLVFIILNITATIGPVLFFIMYAFAIVMVIYTLNRDINPAFKIVWILPVMIFPILGTLMYFFVRRNRLMKRFVKKNDVIQEASNHLIPENSMVIKSLQAYSQNAVRISNYLYNSGYYPTCRMTDTQYFPSGEAAFKQMTRELIMAKDYIFIEFFIINEGRMWNTILDILEKKVSEGVEVRVMYDGMGCMTTLPQGYEKILEKKGIKACVFNPIIPVLSTQQNNRDHRKIMAIDGKVVFTGGVNIADEYINEEERFGYWKDAAIMLKGEAVGNFVLMFLQMWHIMSKMPVTETSFTRYLSKVQPSESGSGFVIGYADNPLDNEPMGENVYLELLYGAKEYIYIMTPYLILTNEMITAMKIASASGVDVRLVLPHIPDKQYAFNIARSHYPQLLAAGVKIYEFTPGFVHSKVVVSDGRKAVVGSINFDYRSLYHHFECAVFMYGTKCIPSIVEDFKNTFEVSQKMTLEDYKNTSIFSRAEGRFLKIVAPLL